MGSSTSDQNWSGYGRLVVEIERPPEQALVVCATAPGECGAWPWPTTDAVYLLTAWNPGSERPGLDVNRARQRELEDELRPRVAGLWPSAGTDPETGARDEGVAVAGLAEGDVLEVAARYGQDAVFRWSPEEWAIVGCDGQQVVSMGWKLLRQT
jgi:hypothetical protein